MNPFRRIATALVLAFALATSACGGGSSTAQGTGQGTVAGVDAGKGEITIDHGAIPGVMGAMTMTFTVADKAILANVAPGAKVEFDVKQEGSDYIVTGIRPR
jgi:Cu(I)/Ag(I) efflux system protein CusF